MPKARIFYYSLPDEMRRRDKLDWFRENKFDRIPFIHLLPDDKHNWINLTDNNFDSLLPVANKEVKAGKKKEALFELFSLGVVTNRDEWVYDFDEKCLEQKVKFFCKFYEAEKIRWNESDKRTPINNFVKRTIKWTEELEAYLKKGASLSFDKDKIRLASYRPFCKKYSYVDKVISHRIYQNQDVWGIKRQFSNLAIILTVHPQVDLSFFCSNLLVDQGFGSRASTILPLYHYDANGVRHDNITDWGLQQFHAHYGDGSLSKQDLFHYTYALLHDPAYRAKYELNLKREFPRLPFYTDFWQWAAWGKQLMELHLGYETAEPYPLERQDVPLAVARARSEASKKAMLQFSMLAGLLQGEPSKTDRLVQPKCKLKANKETGTIEIDEETTLRGIPPEAWDYKLGNRSALEWVLDQYKEKKPSDPTIAEKFNTYRFADYKETVIELLKKVCTVSVATMAVIAAMQDAER